MTDIDTVAEAIRQADDFEEVLQTQWADMSDELRDIYRRMAQAAIDALGLTELVDKWEHTDLGASESIAGAVIGEATMKECAAELRKVIGS